MQSQNLMDTSVQGPDHLFYIQYMSFNSSGLYTRNVYISGHHPWKLNLILKLYGT